jgi:hypothetical protein
VASNVDIPPVARRTNKKPYETYSALLRRALIAARLPDRHLAGPCEVVPRTVARWVAGETLPNPHQQRAIVYLLDEAGLVPRDLLAELAAESNDTLESLGIVPPAPPPPPLPPAVPANAQRIVDDAIREAAEALDVTPRVLRPILARAFAALAEGKVPADAAARLAVAAPAKKG